jgi:hypothetical protein
VTVTVVSLDKTRYRIGEEVTFEIKVMNSGKETIVVPWTPHLGDLEPADTHSSYKYRVGVVLLLFRDPEGIEFPIWETLYGSLNVAGTLRVLSPGEWFTVRGRKKLEPYHQNWGKKELRESGIVVANVSGFYRQDRGTYSPKDGGSDSQCCIQKRFARLAKSKRWSVQFLGGILRLACACDTEHNARIRKLEVQSTDSMLTLRAEGYGAESPLAQHLAAARYLLELASNRPVFIAPSQSHVA